MKDSTTSTSPVLIKEETRNDGLKKKAFNATLKGKRKISKQDNDVNDLWIQFLAEIADCYL